MRSAHPGVHGQMGNLRVPWMVGLSGDGALISDHAISVMF
jgi:hypothetical protein